MNSKFEAFWGPWTGFSRQERVEKPAKTAEMRGFERVGSGKRQNPAFARVHMRLNQRYEGQIAAQGAPVPDCKPFQTKSPGLALQKYDPWNCEDMRRFPCLRQPPRSKQFREAVPTTEQDEGCGFRNSKYSWAEQSTNPNIRFRISNQLTMYTIDFDGKNIEFEKSTYQIQKYNIHAFLSSNL